MGSEASLGKALNAGIEAASGEVITKMDDDDWYGREHLWDLMLALEYSGAELVGKGAEFVYLQEPDLTIRRFVGKAESSNRTLGGGSITMLRSAFDAVDGFRDLAHGEDQAIIDDLLEAGVRRSRTHGRVPHPPPPGKYMAGSSRLFPLPRQGSAAAGSRSTGRWETCLRGAVKAGIGV